MDNNRNNRNPYKGRNSSRRIPTDNGRRNPTEEHYGRGRRSEQRDSYLENPPFFNENNFSEYEYPRQSREREVYPKRAEFPFEEYEENHVQDFRREKKAHRFSENQEVANTEEKNGKSKITESGIAKNIKNSRKNRRLLDELNADKKPLSKGQRKLKSIIFTGTVVGVILIIGVILSLTVLFKCEEIVVEGNTMYNEEEIIEVSELNYGDNIFWAAHSSASTKIEEHYAYIEKADVVFSMPSTVKIKIEEAQPEYYIQDGTKFYVVSKGGKILEETTVKELGIPNIIGCHLITPKVGGKIEIQNDKIMTVLKEIAVCMENNGVTGILEIDLSDMSNIELNYNDRIKIVLGMPEYIDYKMRTAMTIILNKLSEADVGRLNCSNLVEGRTDNKGNASYFQPNHLVNETPTNSVSIMATEPTTEAETQTVAEISTQEIIPPEENPVQEIEVPTQEVFENMFSATETTNIE